MKLERSFYERDTLVVAKELLGCVLIHETREGTTSGRIVETEAYLGPGDKGAHSYGGRHTKLMDPLFKTGGFAYIFQVHGNNFCFNVVTEKKNMPHAVLIRALEPIKGISIMAIRRRIDPSESRSKLRNLTNGPSKLCQALSINKSFNGIDLCGNEIFIEKGNILEAKEKIVSSRRINIDYAEEFKDKPWRFLLDGNMFVSKKI